MSEELAKLMLEELRGVRADIRDIRNSQEALKIDVAALKVKAGIWGSLGGAVVAIGVLILNFAKAVAGGGP